jgi:hypothetical protein
MKYIIDAIDVDLVKDSKLQADFTTGQITLFIDEKTHIPLQYAVAERIFKTDKIFVQARNEQLFDCRRENLKVEKLGRYIYPNNNQFSNRTFSTSRHIRGFTISLGTYKTPELAAVAHDLAMYEIHDYLENLTKELKCANPLSNLGCSFTKQKLEEKSEKTSYDKWSQIHSTVPQKPIFQNPQFKKLIENLRASSSCNTQEQTVESNMTATNSSEEEPIRQLVMSFPETDKTPRFFGVSEVVKNKNLSIEQFRHYIKRKYLPEPKKNSDPYGEPYYDSHDIAEIDRIFSVKVGLNNLPFVPACQVDAAG